MGLENLKSVFAEGAGTNNSQISGRLTGGGELGPFVNHPDEFSSLDFGTNIPTPVDFLTSPIPGFTIRMDSIDKSQFSPDGIDYIQPMGMIEKFGQIGMSGEVYNNAVDFLSKAEANPISGFDLNFKDRDASKYIGQTSKFNNNQTVGTIPFAQPPLVKSLNGIRDRNIGLQTNTNIFDNEGNFIFRNQDIDYTQKPVVPDRNSLENRQFNTLYGTKQTTKEIKQGSDRLRLRADTGGIAGLFGISNPFSGKLNNRGDEPYVISEIGNHTAGRDFPIERSLLDAQRIIRFMTSQAGLFFIAKQNFLGFNTKVVTAQYLPPLLGVESPIKVAKRQRFQSSYNPLSTLGSLVRTLGGQVPNVGVGFLLNREDPFPLDPTRSILPRNYSDSIATRKVFAPGKQEDEFTSPINPAVANLFSNIASAFGAGIPRDFPKKGDKMTLSPMIKGDRLISVPKQKTYTIPPTKSKPTAETNIESEEAGLPFYFKDLRDKSYVFFRAYLQGITENVSPSWTSENYIGRSEPVYIYERAERDISFTLRLFATTQDELPKIYEKMNKLTSMCYPEYKEDMFTAKTKEVAGISTKIAGTGKVRMKPPLVKFRMGDIYGSANNEMTGFLKSISYTIPDNSVWETSRGKKVPKFIDASIGYQVIHGSVPELESKFYGYTGGSNLFGGFI